MRIVSLSPSFTEILEHFECAAEFVGITDHCPELLHAPARVGSPKALRLDVIENLRPDLVLSAARENQPEEIRAIEKKFRVVSFDVRSIDQTLDAVAALGRLINAFEQSQKLASEITQEYQLCKNEKELPRVRTMILLWNIPFLTVNFNTYISRVLESAGGLNIFREDPLPEFPIELEDIIEKEPEILFLPTAPFPFKKSDIKRFRQYRILSKISIELVNGRLFSRFGPATVESLRSFREIFSKVRACQPKV